MPGRDSTGYALSNVIHVLARRPEIYQKLREEVSSVDSEQLTFELLKSMKYTQWVINEGMLKEKSFITGNIVRPC